VSNYCVLIGAMMLKIIIIGVEHIIGQRAHRDSAHDVEVERMQPSLL
jgi:hypothetical protein